MTRTWTAWVCLSVIVGYGVAWALAIAYAGRGVETALLGFAWGVAWVSVTPSVLRSLSRRLR